MVSGKVFSDSGRNQARKPVEARHCKMKVTGSKTLSEIAGECGVTGGEFRLEIIGDASPVAGAMVAPTVRVAASDFFLALAGAGAVGEALLARSVEFAAARAEGREIAADTVAAAEKLKARAEGFAAEFAAKLPPIERKGSLRIKAEACAI